jgi:hypothetical protein
MTKQQFDKAVALATSQEDLSAHDDNVLHGCGLPDFRPVTVTLAACARFIRWHCVCLNGTVDSEALNDMRAISRKRWLVAG